MANAKVEHPTTRNLAQDLARVLDRLACTECHQPLVPADGGLKCSVCAAAYPEQRGVIDLRPETARSKPEFVAWSKHWSSEVQQSASQRFFSFYRQAVFARTVAYFVRRYFPESGVLVEAGSGTAETSIRIDKLGGRRLLAAVDIIPEVLERCAPIMDVRLAADIFRLPFATGSVDGVWNVGVMEHFVHSEIDQILQEIHRVLRPSAVVVLLWPARDSLPQKLLRAIEWVVNKRRAGQEPFRFHPDEISKLRSSDEGREVLRRNRFEPVEVEFGLRSLMAFKTVVGRKPVDDSGRTRAQ